MANGMVDKALQQIWKDGIKLKRLWINASPESAFPAQKINLNIPEDGLVLITARVDTYPYNGTVSGVGRVGEDLFLIGSTSRNRGRMLKLTTSGVECDDALQWNNYGSSSNAHGEYMIPLEIYGIKILAGGGSKFINRLRSLFSFRERRCAVCL